MNMYVRRWLFVVVVVVVVEERTSAHPKRPNKPTHQNDYTNSIKQ